MTIRQDLHHPSREAVLAALGIDPKVFAAFQEQTSGGLALPATSLPDAVEAYLASRRRLSASTAATHRTLLHCFLAFMTAPPYGVATVQGIKADHVLTFVTRPRLDGAPRNPQSMNRDLSIISAFFHHLVRQEVLRRNPTEGVERAQEPQSAPKALSEAEQSRLLDLSRRTFNPIRNYTLIYLVLNTGLRAQEVCDLTWKEIDLTGGFLRVVEGKGGKDRTIPLVPEVVGALSYYLNCYRKRQIACPGHADAVFLNTAGPHWGRAMTVDGVELMLDPLLRALGKPKGSSTHVLRHTFAVNLLRKGVHIAVIAALLGHTSFETTQKYLRLGDPEVSRALAEICPEGVLVPGISRMIGRSRVEAAIDQAFSEEACDG